MVNMRIMTKIADLIERKDNALFFEWIIRQYEINPAWAEVYNCPNHTTKFTCKATAYIELDHNDPEMYLWCVYNCKGKWMSWAEYMGNPIPGTEEGFMFENPDDCVRFKLTFATLSINWEKYGLKNPFDK